MIYLLQTILRLLVLYFILALLLGYLPVNTDFHEKQGGIEIFVVTNGVHTDLVLPVNYGKTSWQQFFTGTVLYHKFYGMQYIAFGWGNKLFYLNTPEWKDLTFSIAFRALFTERQPAMHVTLVSGLVPGNEVVPVYISAQQLEIITGYIRDSFFLTDTGKPESIAAKGYGDYDLFFYAKGKFSLIKSCNVWTNEGLKAAGIRCSVWSPFDKPILFQLSHSRK